MGLRAIGLRCQQACLGLEGMKEVLGDKFVDRWDYHGIRGKETDGRLISTKSKRLQGIPQNVYTIPYLMWAYGVNKCSFKRSKNGNKYYR
jgi:hypothetical protein